MSDNIVGRSRESTVDQASKQRFASSCSLRGRRTGLHSSRHAPATLRTSLDLLRLHHLVLFCLFGDVRRRLESPAVRVAPVIENVSLANGGSSASASRGNAHEEQRDEETHACGCSLKTCGDLVDDAIDLFRFCVCDPLWHSFNERLSVKDCVIPSVDVKMRAAMRSSCQFPPTGEKTRKNRAENANHSVGAVAHVLVV